MTSSSLMSRTAEGPPVLIAILTAPLALGPRIGAW